MVVPSVLFLMADYGHDPTETAIPYKVFKEAGFAIQFATENGKTPSCDKKMLEGWTQKLLGANRAAIQAYDTMSSSPEFTTPLSWTSSDFLSTASKHDILFFPGGHEKSVRQQIDSPVLHQLLTAYFPTTKKPSPNHVGAICHGVLAVTNAPDPTDSTKSVLYECNTTALPGLFEGFAYNATRLVLGDYYKTYGAGSENVEAVVKGKLKEPAKQWKGSTSGSPFVVADDTYNYVSGRFPPDAEKLAQTLVAMVKESTSKASASL